MVLADIGTMSVRKEAPRCSVPLVGWMAARYLAEHFDPQCLLDQKALVTFRESDLIVREEGHELLKKARQR